MTINSQNWSSRKYLKNAFFSLPKFWLREKSFAGLFYFSDFGLFRRVKGKFLPTKLPTNWSHFIPFWLKCHLLYRSNFFDRPARKSSSSPTGRSIFQCWVTSTYLNKQRQSTKKEWSHFIRRVQKTRHLFRYGGPTFWKGLSCVSRRARIFRLLSGIFGQGLNEINVFVQSMKPLYSIIN